MSNTETTTANTETTTGAAAGGVAGAGVGGVVGGLGLVPASDTTGVGVAGVGGPFVVGEVVGSGGDLVGLVGVVDDGSDIGGGPDALLGLVLDAAAAELGGQPRSSSPVGTGDELMARFTLPVSGVVYTDTNGTGRVAYITTTDRRTTTTTGPTTTNTTTTPGPGAGVGAGPGVGFGGGGLEKLAAVSLEVSVELGRTRVTLADVLGFDVGSSIELDRAAGAPVDIRVNDTLLALGEVVLIDDEYAVRITQIIDPGPNQ